MGLKFRIKEVGQKGLTLEDALSPEVIGFTGEDYLQFVEPVKIKAEVRLIDDMLLAEIKATSRFRSFDYRTLDDVERDWKENFTLDYEVTAATDHIDLTEDIRQEIILSVPLRILKDEEKKDQATVVPFADELDEEVEKYNPFEELEEE